MDYLTNPIKVARPKLPAYINLQSYFEQIDESRHYSNFGPLVMRFEERISQKLHFNNQKVAVTASSGSSALELIIKQYEFTRGSNILLPAFTFIATAQAVVDSGLIPVFTDVDLNSWALEPDAAIQYVESAQGIVSALIVVAPFGTPLDIKKWEKFQIDTGIQVIVDAAACCLEDITVSRIIPIMISTHATKVLPSGEGGLVIIDDSKFLSSVSECSNFGINQAGISRVGSNHKLSEYHAAVGLASLDQWEQTCNSLTMRCELYRKSLGKIETISFLPGFGNNWFNITCMVAGPEGLENFLSSVGIETRKWWRAGCHREPLFKDESVSVPNTDYLTSRYIGLPLHVDIELDKINYICQQIERYCLSNKDRFM